MDAPGENDVDELEKKIDEIVSRGPSGTSLACPASAAMFAMLRPTTAPPTITDMSPAMPPVPKTMAPRVALSAGSKPPVSRQYR